MPTHIPNAQVIPWLSALGYSLCYGPILARMFRDYYIYCTQKQYVSSYKFELNELWNTTIINTHAYSLCRTAT